MNISIQEILKLHRESAKKIGTYDFRMMWHEAELFKLLQAYEKEGEQDGIRPQTTAH